MASYIIVCLLTNSNTISCAEIWSYTARRHLLYIFMISVSEDVNSKIEQHRYNILTIDMTQLNRKYSKNNFASVNLPSMNISVLLLNTSLAAPGALAHRPQRRTACQWAPKWPTGSGKVSTPRFWGAPVNFR